MKWLCNGSNLVRMVDGNDVTNRSPMAPLTYTINIDMRCFIHMFVMTDQEFVHEEMIHQQ